MGRQRWSENFLSKSWESVVVHPLLKNAKRSWTRFSKCRVVVFYKIWPIFSSSTSYVCQTAYQITLFFYTVRKIQFALQRAVIKIIKCKDTHASLFLIKYYITLQWKISVDMFLSSVSLYRMCDQRYVAMFTLNIQEFINTNHNASWQNVSNAENYATTLHFEGRWRIHRPLTLYRPKYLTSVWN